MLVNIETESPSKQSDSPELIVSVFRITVHKLCQEHYGGWSGGAMVLGKLPVLERPTVWVTVGQGPIAFVLGVEGGCLDIFTLIYPFLFSFSLSLGDGPI